MRLHYQYVKSITLTALLYTGFAVGSIAQTTSTNDNPETESPVILSTVPNDGDQNVDLNSAFEITFNSEMDETTINETTLMLNATSENRAHEQRSEMPDDQTRNRAATMLFDNSYQGTTDAVNGTISYSDKIAVFTPDQDLKVGTQYTFTVTNGVKNSENIALERDKKWSFSTTRTSDSAYSDEQNGSYDMNSYAMGRMEYAGSASHISLKDKENMIDLGKAGQFVILASTDINNQSDSRITGHIGEGSMADSTKKQDERSDSAQQTTYNQAAVFPSNQSDTTSPDVNEAIEDMMTAYSSASSQNGDDLTSHQYERFNSSELTPGVHKWNSSLHLESDVTLAGREDDVWLIKVNDNLIVDEDIVITLSDEARADNIFWYVEGEVTIGKNAQFEGIILSMNEITLGEGAILNGRMFSQTSITLNGNTVTEPERMDEQASSINR